MIVLLNPDRTWGDFKPSNPQMRCANHLTIAGSEAQAVPVQAKFENHCYTG